MSERDARNYRGAASFDFDGEDHDWVYGGKLSLWFAFRHQLWFQVRIYLPARSVVIGTVCRGMCLIRLYMQILLGLVFVGLPTLLVNELVEPRQRFFMAGDPTISYPGPNEVCVCCAPMFIDSVWLPVTAFRYSTAKPSLFS